MYSGSDTARVDLSLMSSPKWRLSNGGGFPPNDDSGTQIHCLAVLLSSTAVAKVFVFLSSKLWKEKERVGSAPLCLNCRYLEIACRFLSDFIGKN